MSEINLENEKPRKIKPENVILALDIGTEFVKTVIAERTEDDNLIVIGVGKEHQSMGNMYAGAIADIPAVVSTCEKALSNAEGMAGVISKTCVVGIAGDSGFVSINMSKYLMNREVGFGRKVLQILEDLNIGWEHMPTGIDDLSIILRSRELTPIKEEEILRQLVQKAEVDHAEIEHDLSIIMIVGEKMKSHIGVTATATRALSENKINIQMMSQGSSEVSIMFVVHKDQEKAAIKALYNAFFGESKED